MAPGQKRPLPFPVPVRFPQGRPVFPPRHGPPPPPPLPPRGLGMQAQMRSRAPPPSRHAQMLRPPPQPPPHIPFHTGRRPPPHSPLQTSLRLGRAALRPPPPRLASGGAPRPGVRLSPPRGQQRPRQGQQRPPLGQAQRRPGQGQQPPPSGQAQRRPGQVQQRPPSSQAQRRPGQVQQRPPPSRAQGRPGQVQQRPPPSQSQYNLYGQQQRPPPSQAQRGDNYNLYGGEPTASTSGQAAHEPAPIVQSGLSWLGPCGQLHNFPPQMAASMPTLSGQSGFQYLPGQVGVPTIPSPFSQLGQMGGPTFPSPFSQLWPQPIVLPQPQPLVLSQPQPQPLVLPQPQPIILSQPPPPPPPPVIYPIVLPQAPPPQPFIFPQQACMHQQASFPGTQCLANQQGMPTIVNNFSPTLGQSFQPPYPGQTQGGFAPAPSVVSGVPFTGQQFQPVYGNNPQPPPNYMASQPGNVGTLQPFDQGTGNRRGQTVSPSLQVQTPAETSLSAQMPQGTAPEESLVQVQLEGTVSLQDERSQSVGSPLLERFKELQTDGDSRWRNANESSSQATSFPKFALPKALHVNGLVSRQRGQEWSFMLDLEPGIESEADGSITHGRLTEEAHKWKRQALPKGPSYVKHSPGQKKYRGSNTRYTTVDEYDGISEAAGEREEFARRDEGQSVSSPSYARREEFAGRYEGQSISSPSNVHYTSQEKPKRKRPLLEDAPLEMHQANEMIQNAADRLHRALSYKRDSGANMFFEGVKYDSEEEKDLKGSDERKRLKKELPHAPEQPDGRLNDDQNDADMPASGLGRAGIAWQIPSDAPARAPPAFRTRIAPQKPYSNARDPGLSLGPRMENVRALQRPPPPRAPEMARQRLPAPDMGRGSGVASQRQRPPVMGGFPGTALASGSERALGAASAPIKGRPPGVPSQRPPPPLMGRFHGTALAPGSESEPGAASAPIRGRPPGVASQRPPPPAMGGFPGKALALGSQRPPGAASAPIRGRPPGVASQRPLLPGRGSPSGVPSQRPLLPGRGRVPGAASGPGRGRASGVALQRPPAPGRGRAPGVAPLPSPLYGSIGRSPEVALQRPEPASGVALQRPISASKVAKTLGVPYLNRKEGNALVHKSAHKQVPGASLFWRPQLAKVEAAQISSEALGIQNAELMGLQPNESRDFQTAYMEHDQLGQINDLNMDEEGLSLQTGKGIHKLFPPEHMELEHEGMFRGLEELETYVECRTPASEQTDELEMDDLEDEGTYVECRTPASEQTDELEMDDLQPSSSLHEFSGVQTADDQVIGNPGMEHHMWDGERGLIPVKENNMEEFDELEESMQQSSNLHEFSSWMHSDDNTLFNHDIRQSPHAHSIDDSGIYSLDINNVASPLIGVGTWKGEDDKAEVFFNQNDNMAQLHKLEMDEKIISGDDMWKGEDDNADVFFNQNDEMAQCDEMERHEEILSGGDMWKDKAEVFFNEYGNMAQRDEEIPSGYDMWKGEDDKAEVFFDQNDNMTQFDELERGEEVPSGYDLWKGEDGQAEVFFDQNDNMVQFDELERDEESPTGYDTWKREEDQTEVFFDQNDNMAQFDELERDEEILSVQSASYVYSDDNTIHDHDASALTGHDTWETGTEAAESDNMAQIDVLGFEEEVPLVQTNKNLNDFSSWIYTHDNMVSDHEDSVLTAHEWEKGAKAAVSSIESGNMEQINMWEEGVLPVQSYGNTSPEHGFSVLEREEESATSGLMMGEGNNMAQATSGLMMSEGNNMTQVGELENVEGIPPMQSSNSCHESSWLESDDNTNNYATETQKSDSSGIYSLEIADNHHLVHDVAIGDITEDNDYMFNHHNDGPGSFKQGNWNGFISPAHDRNTSPYVKLEMQHEQEQGYGDDSMKDMSTVGSPKLSQVQERDPTEDEESSEDDGSYMEGKSWTYWLVLVSALILIAFSSIMIFCFISTSKKPRIHVDSISVQRFQNDNVNDMALDLAIVFSMPNIKSSKFKFEGGMSYIFFNSSKVGEAIVPLPSMKTNSFRSVVSYGLYLASSPTDFQVDLMSGYVLFSTHTCLYGSFTVLNLVRKRFSSSVDCKLDISSRFTYQCG